MGTVSSYKDALCLWDSAHIRRGLGEAGGGRGREEPQSLGQDFRGFLTLDAGEAGISNGGLGRPEQGPQVSIPW